MVKNATHVTFAADGPSFRRSSLDETLVMGKASAKEYAAVMNHHAAQTTTNPETRIATMTAGTAHTARSSSRCDRAPADDAIRYFFFTSVSPESAAMNASWGTSTRPTIFMRFLPSFCFSRSLRLRVMSPP